jgi:hypothetical protein
MNSNDTIRTVNEGIQGNVHADVLAVGRGAQATKHIGGLWSDEMQKAITELRGGFDRIGLEPAARKVLEDDVTGLVAATQRSDPDHQKAQQHLKGIADKLKMVGIMLSDVAALAEPVKKIAEIIRLPLSFIVG